MYQILSRHSIIFLTKLLLKHRIYLHSTIINLVHSTIHLGIKRYLHQMIRLTPTTIIESSHSKSWKSFTRKNSSLANSSANYWQIWPTLWLKLDFSKWLALSMIIKAAVWIIQLIKMIEVIFHIYLWSISK